jgi:hypothetical protein
MAKRRQSIRRRKPKGVTPGRAQRLAALKAAIADGRGRRALGEARELADDDLKPDELTLLGAALTLRAREMLAAGQLTAAADLVTTQLASTPSWEAALSMALRLEMEALSGGGELLANYTSDNDLRAALDQALREDLRTP